MDVGERHIRKPEGYFDSVRDDLVGLVHTGDNVVLEIGCGSGETGNALKKSKKAKVVFGVELVPSVAEQAKQKLDGVVVGDVEAVMLPFESDSFDYIIAGDVLEHLKDPWAVLEKLRPLLKSEGLLIASIPNVRFWRVVRDLVLRGRWDYKEHGILDNTHLRFFTKRSMVEMLDRCGYSVERVFPPPLGPRARWVCHLRSGLLEELVTPRYICEARRRR